MGATSTGTSTTDADAGDGGEPCGLGATSCADIGANCGPIGDGCGNLIQCGDCSVGKQTCGGGGKPSVCGGDDKCIPVTCTDLGYSCGQAGDGCGHPIDCGVCPNGQSCGTGGKAGVCALNPVCQALTCTAQNINCGPAGDGCGHAIDCGTCPAGQTCGGGGKASQCGTPPCTPLTCADLSLLGNPITCGPAGDGCGGVLDCGTCASPATCGGGGALGACGSPPCLNLCKQQVACAGAGVTTTVSGVVYAPGHATDPAPPAAGSADPLYNVLVYVPNSPVQPFPVGPVCGCGADISGEPLVQAYTGIDGSFVLKNVPVGTNIPLVIQTGRWRRQIVIPSVAACTNTVLTPAQTRLPRNKTEGDIPQMAFSTGSVDALECVMRKIGIDDSEFTKPDGTGRVHLYVGNGDTMSGGANAGAGTPDDSQLWGSAATLNKYDMVLFPCQGKRYDKASASQQNVIKYANAGGRVFATHFSYVWLYNDSPFNTTANWQVDGKYPADQTGYINTNFPRGAALASWLVNVKATPTIGQIPIQVLRNDVHGLPANSQSLDWMDITSPAVTMHYTFDTPVGAAPANQCGRVLFDDFHVEDTLNMSTHGKTFPTECAAGAMTPQEKMLEYMLFDLGASLCEVPPACSPTTCAAQGITCGPAGDGCGNVLDCGSCPAGQTCGANNIPGQCGVPPCQPVICEQLQINCGTANDGCGNILDCGVCPPGETCGGSGAPGVCGAPNCTKLTCAGLGFNCGPAGDGCGGLLDCGPCVAPETCGGGGVSNMCGAPNCTPTTCALAGADCGAIADGCGGAVQCGPCLLPGETCGGGGIANKCGSKAPPQ